MPILFASDGEGAIEKIKEILPQKRRAAIEGVQERATARWQPPVNASTEEKMLAAARQIKRAFREARGHDASDVEIYMYNPVFPLVTW